MTKLVIIIIILIVHYIIKTIRHCSDTKTNIVDEVKTKPSPGARRLDSHRYTVNTGDDNYYYYRINIVIIVLYALQF